MTHNKTWACIKPDGDGCDGDHMTDQPKPRGPLSDEDRKAYEGLYSTLNHWADRDVLALDSALRTALAEVKELRRERNSMVWGPKNESDSGTYLAEPIERSREMEARLAEAQKQCRIQVELTHDALAEVDTWKGHYRVKDDLCSHLCTENSKLEAQLKDLQRLHDSNLERWQVSEQTFVTKHEADLKSQLAQVTQERDSLEKEVKTACRIMETFNIDLGLSRKQLLAASAENVLMREALDSVLGHHSHSSRCVSTDEAWECELSTVEQTAKNALSTPSSELTAALSELVEAAERVSSRGWDSCLPKALARVDAALGKV